MNKLILCEGETDAILLSYYLGRVSGWTYSPKGPQGVSIHKTEQNETVNWYKKGNDFLLICAVGGKDNFKYFYEKKIKPPLLTSDAFEKISIVTDRDQREIESIEASVASILNVNYTTVKNNQWFDCSYTNKFSIKKTFRALLLAIPNEQQGALETAMLCAISENPYDKRIVEEAGQFADQMKTTASQYISTDRLRLKAHLGLTWAVQYPEKVFSRIDEQIRNVRWESSETLRACFATLLEI